MRVTQKFLVTIFTILEYYHSYLGAGSDAGKEAYTAYHFINK